VAQRAIVMVLEAVYEQDFLPCSYGFRPGRSAEPVTRCRGGNIPTYSARVNRCRSQQLPRSQIPVRSTPDSGRA
jgi:hypothetical protein